MYRAVFICSVCGLALLGGTSGQAGIISKAIREAVEFAGRKFGKEVAEEGVERLSVKMMKLAAKHGDDVVAAAFKKVGPRAGRIAGEAGEHGGLALKLLARHGDEALPVVAKAASLKAVARYGDDAAVAFVRHGAVGEQFVGRFAREGAEALAKVTPQNGRRLAMLAVDGQLKPELLSVVTRYGDEACDFVWRNKGSLVVGTALAAFVASPEEFLDGTQKLTSVVAEAAVKPLAEVPKTIAAEAARNTNWTVLAIFTVIMVIVAAGARREKTGMAFRVVKSVVQARRERNAKKLD